MNNKIVFEHGMCGWAKGETVTDEQIKEAGGDPQHWRDMGATERIADEAPVAVAAPVVELVAEPIAEPVVTPEPVVAPAPGVVGWNRDR